MKRGVLIALSGGLASAVLYLAFRTNAAGALIFTYLTPLPILLIGLSTGIKFGGGEFAYNYNLSKQCLEFIPSTYKDWAKKNVLINNLRIGVTNTKVHKRMKKNIKMSERVKLIPINRMAEPKEISAYIVDLTTAKNSYMTGQTITVSGGE